MIEMLSDMITLFKACNDQENLTKAALVMSFAYVSQGKVQQAENYISIFEQSGILPQETAFLYSYIQIKKGGLTGES